MGTSEEHIKLLTEKQDLVEKLYTNIKNQESEIRKGRIKRLNRYFEEAKILFEGIEAVDHRLKGFVDKTALQAVRIKDLIDKRIKEIQEINNSAIVEANSTKKDVEQVLVIIRKSKKALKDGYGKTMRPARSNVMDKQV